MDWNTDSAAMIGRTVVEPTGRRLGKVIAIIHAVHGVDILVERRRWLRRRGDRIPIEDVVDGADGTMVVATTHLLGRRTGSIAAPGAEVAPKAEQR